MDYQRKERLLEKLGSPWKRFLSLFKKKPKGSNDYYKVNADLPQVKKVNEQLRRFNEIARKISK